MANDMTYKVLWVDDDESIVEAYVIKAEDYNIDLCHVSNWEEAEKRLKSDFDDYSAIILDAECKMNSSAPEESSFINKVRWKLEGIFGRKQARIPWYILSAGTMKGFDSAMETAQYGRTEYEEEWGCMLYSKTGSSQNGNGPDNLFESIVRVASNKASNIVLYRYQDTFRYLGEGKLLGKDARDIMLKMLCSLHNPEANAYFEYQGNPLRKVMEYLYRAAHRKGLLPTECFNERGQVNLLDANRFMSGKDTSHSKLRYGQEGDSIFPEYMGHITRDILNFTNSDSHTTEENLYTIYDDDLTINENEKELFFSYVLQLCHVIKHFGHFVEQHSDKQENLKMIRKVGS